MIKDNENQEWKICHVVFFNWFKYLLHFDKHKNLTHSPDFNGLLHFWELLFCPYKEDLLSFTFYSLYSYVTYTS